MVSVSCATSTGNVALGLAAPIRRTSDETKDALSGCPECDRGGAGGYRSGSLMPDAGDGCGSQKAPSESARHPNTDVPYGGLQQRGGQEVGRVRGLLVR